MSIWRILSAGLVALLLVVMVESLTSLDMTVQRLCLDEAGQWLIDRATHARVGRWLYTGPKVLLGVLGGVALLVVMASFTRRWALALASFRRPCLVLALALAAGPLVVALLKHYSGVG